MDHGVAPMLIRLIDWSAWCVEHGAKLRPGRFHWRRLGLRRAPGLDAGLAADFRVHAIGRGVAGRGIEPGRHGGMPGEVFGAARNRDEHILRHLLGQLRVAAAAAQGRSVDHTDFAADKLPKSVGGTPFGVGLEQGASIAHCGHSYKQAGTGKPHRKAPCQSRRGRVG